MGISTQPAPPPASFPILSFTLCTLSVIFLAHALATSRATPGLAPHAPAPHPPSGVLRVALLGDSITLGQMCSSGGYGKYLAPALGARHYHVASFCDNGKTMLRTDPATNDTITLDGKRLPFVDAQLWADARAFDAEIYLVMLGTNDASTWWGEEAYKRAYADFIATLRAQPAAPTVFVVAPPPTYNGSPFLFINHTVTNEVLPLRTLPALCAATGAPLIDVFSALGGRNISGFVVGDFFCDGIHPWPAGSDRIARVVYRALWRRLVVSEGWPPFEQGVAFCEGVPE